jgi:hypothetical protein
MSYMPYVTGCPCMMCNAMPMPMPRESGDKQKEQTNHKTANEQN